MLKQYLECGKIVSTHGVHGEVRVQPWCDSPEYLCGFKTLYFELGQTPVVIEKARVNKNMALLKLAGVDTLDDAALLRGRVLYINRGDAPDDGLYFIQDLIGINVIDADNGRNWGTVKDVIKTGANDVYVLDDNGTERLVPVIPDVITKFDMEAGIILIRPLKGLFGDED